MIDLDPERWLDRHGDLLFRYALARVGEVDLAEDLVQETLLSAWRGSRSFSGNASESTWLVGILKHKIADHFRKSPPLSIEDLGLDLDRYFDDRGHWRQAPANWDEPDKNLDREQLKEGLRDCVGRLPPRFRYLFYLREVDGLSGEEICQLLPAPSTNSVWVMLSRMRFKLRQCLERAGFGRINEESR
ncbi:MAG: sigma-70 family RNA polymerase sigma factor [Methylothermaceae bacterium]|nr:sigma-70 family RNA polymerase sigma factor [Methylothermaceae bacterium]